MKRLEFFIQAMKAEMFRRTDWVITAFALIQEDANAWKKNPYPYRLVQTPSGVMYVNPYDVEELLPLEDSISGKPPFDKAERINLSPDDAPNITGKIETCYGNLLYNYTVLVYAFGSKMQFITGKVSPNQVEDLILPRLHDTPDDKPLSSSMSGVVELAQTERDPNKLYVDEYLRFVDATFYLANFAPLWVPAGTEKSLLPPPGIKEYRNELLQHNADRLDDPQVIALIAKQLIDFDKAFLAGDKALDSMLSKKAFEVVRARKFLMHGGEVGLSDSIKIDLVANSLYEGLDPRNFAIVNNAARAGSFNRGAQTMLGGELVKWLLRASSNINVLDTDCGTKLGARIKLIPAKRKQYLNFTIQTSEGPIRLTDDVIDSYMGKQVAVRSPQYCKAGHTDICKVCAGPRLEDNPTAASAGISNYGSVLMLIYMKAMHGKALTVAEYHFEDSLT